MSSSNNSLFSTISQDDFYNAAEMLLSEANDNDDVNYDVYFGMLKGIMQLSVELNIQNNSNYLHEHFEELETPKGVGNV